MQKGTMQNGKSNRFDGRVPIPVNRGSTGYAARLAKTTVDYDKKKQEEKALGASVVNIPDDGKARSARKIPPASGIPTKSRRKVIATDDRVSPSIQKLLSVYESGEKSDVPRKTVPSRYSVMRTERGKRVAPASSDKARVTKEPESPIRKIPLRRKTTPVERVTQPGETSATVKPKEDHVETSLNIINTVITNYLEDKAQERPLDFLLTGYDRGVFPVCSKKATDNIPTSEVTPVVRDGRMPEKSDLIVMLRRRNSEPYSPKSCLLQYDDADRPLGSYYFWDSRPTQPYWEVSLFKANRSLSVLSSRAVSGMLSLTPGSGSSLMLPAGRFDPRKAVVEKKPSWLRAIQSPTDDPKQTKPFITLMEKEKIVTRKPQPKPKDTQPEKRPTPVRRPTRVFSKDDHYKPPGHLLIYVKSSQKKLITVDASESHPENPVNKRVHKLARVRRSNVVLRSSWQKRILVTATTTVIIIVAAFVYFLQFFNNQQSVSNLTPPIPRVVRGC